LRNAKNMIYDEKLKLKKSQKIRNALKTNIHKDENKKKRKT